METEIYEVRYGIRITKQDSVKQEKVKVYELTEFEQAKVYYQDLVKNNPDDIIVLTLENPTTESIYDVLECSIDVEDVNKEYFGEALNVYNNLTEKEIKYIESFIMYTHQLDENMINIKDDIIEEIRMLIQVSEDMEVPGDYFDIDEATLTNLGIDNYDPSTIISKIEQRKELGKIFVPNVYTYEDINHTLDDVENDTEMLYAEVMTAMGEIEFYPILNLSKLNHHLGVKLDTQKLYYNDFEKVLMYGYEKDIYDSFNVDDITKEKITEEVEKNPDIEGISFYMNDVLFLSADKELMEQVTEKIFDYSELLDVKKDKGMSM